jgi:serine/threonine-protein kinase HipA
MDKQGVWRLSPAFDVCYAYNPNSYWVNSHSMSINGKRSNITRNDLLTVAKNMNIKKANNIIDQIADVVSNWNNYAKRTSVNTALKKEISKNLLLL